MCTGLALCFGLALVAGVTDAASASVLDSWGSNGYGNLANGNTTGPEKCFVDRPGVGETACSRKPLLSVWEGAITSVSGGKLETSMGVEDGTAMAWGSNDQGELGKGTVVAGAPMPIPWQSVRLNQNPAQALP